MSRIAAALLLVLLMSVASPLEAARRVAIIVDRGSGAPGEADAGFQEFASALIGSYGFDVLRSVTGPGRNLERDMDDFRQRIVESEIALLLYSGPVEHDRDGTYLVEFASSSGRPASRVKLDELLIHMVNNSQHSVAVLEASGPAMSAERRPGFGRMPVVPGKLLIAVADGPRFSRSGPAAIRSALLPVVEGRAIRFGAVVDDLRERVFLDSAGLRLVQRFGSLQEKFVLEIAPERDRVVQQLRDRARDMCEADYRKAPDKVERSLTTHFAKSVDGVLPSQPFSLVNTFSLNAMLDELAKSTACPYAAAVPAVATFRPPVPQAPALPQAPAVTPLEPVATPPATPAALTPAAPPPPLSVTRPEVEPKPSTRNKALNRARPDEPRRSAPVVKRIIEAERPAARQPRSKPSAIQTAPANRGGGGGGGGGARPVNVPL